MWQVQIALALMTTKYWVYIAECSDGTLYTGGTTELRRRIDEHNGVLPGGAKYTRARRPVKCVYRESCHSRSAAQQRESQIKAMTRKQKTELVDSC